VFFFRLSHNLDALFGELNGRGKCSQKVVFWKVVEILSCHQVALNVEQ
jgi:hypothetical protein